jgi:hemin uptake protein HemP
MSSSPLPTPSPAGGVDRPAPTAPHEADAPVRVISSDALFDGASELLIEHHGARYRLRHTALGKLILTK